MIATVKISSGKRYYDLRAGEELTVLCVAHHLGHVHVEIESGVQETRRLSDFLKALRQGRIVLVEEICPPEANDVKH